jgi:ATP-dependent Clp protease adaptor protein ClpS
MSELLDKQTNKQAIKPPSVWNVVFINDDFTPMDFVMYCCMTIFGKTEEQAYQLTMAVHESGKGIAGQYPRDIAETKQQMCLELARLNEHPFQVRLEQV